MIQIEPEEDAPDMLPVEVQCHLRKANENHPDQVIPATTIHIGPTPLLESDEDAELLDALCSEDANRLTDALFASLPAKTLVHLTNGLLRRMPFRIVLQDNADGSHLTP